MRYEIEVDERTVLVEVKQYDKNGDLIVVQTVIMRSHTISGAVQHEKTDKKEKKKSRIAP